MLVVLSSPKLTFRHSIAEANPLSRSFRHRSHHYVK
jgi:hypothetical protein